MVRKYDPSLVIYLPFYEGAGDIAHDVTGNGNNGVIYGAEWVDTGISKLGFGLNFGGDDYVVCTDFALQQQSVGVWVKFNSVSGWQTMVSKAASYTHVIQLGKTGYNRFRFRLNETESYYVHVDSTTTATSGVWYHIFGTWDGSTLRIYVNGQLENEWTYTGNVYESGSWQIGRGRFRGDWSDYADCIISEVRIYNRALSFNEIERLYHLGYIRYVSVPSIIHSLNL